MSGNWKLNTSLELQISNSRYINTKYFAVCTVNLLITVFLDNWLFAQLFLHARKSPKSAHFPAVTMFTFPSGEYRLNIRPSFGHFMPPRTSFLSPTSMKYNRKDQNSCCVHRRNNANIYIVPSYLTRWLHVKVFPENLDPTVTNGKRFLTTI